MGNKALCWVLSKLPYVSSDVENLVDEMEMGNMSKKEAFNLVKKSPTRKYILEDYLGYN